MGGPTKWLSINRKDRNLCLAYCGGLLLLSSCSNNSIDNNQTDYKIDPYPNLIQEVSGSYTFRANGESINSPAKASIVGNMKKGPCAAFKDCQYEYTLRINLDVTDLVSSSMVETAYFDNDFKYLGSIDSDGVRCIPKVLLKPQMTATIGTSGDSPLETCSDGTKTMADYWVLKSASNGNAEFISYYSRNDGSEASTTLLIDKIGNINGMKMTVSGKVDSGIFYFRLGNY